ncbi:MAG: hypothetical protein RR959_07375 [Erysipelotrichaceae bacterium]
MDHIFFNRLRSILVCIVFMCASFLIEIRYGLDNFFSSSGTIFTLAGLFLNIKLTNLFHLKQENEEGKKVPLNLTSKYYLIVQAFGFAEEVTEDTKQRTVREREADEICGVALMIFGTILWGYGSYFIIYWNNLS